jgi:hypothetical protein
VSRVSNKEISEVGVVAKSTTVLETSRCEISKSSFCQVVLVILSVLFASQGPEETLSFVLNRLLKVVSQ